MFHSKFDDAELNDYMSTQDSIYIFGYGSLLWKVSYEYENKFYGYVENFERQFNLLSDDHRGTPEKLGRVLTLVESPMDTQNEKKKKRVYGIAYKLKSTNLSVTINNLNFREKCGYSLKQIIFHHHHNKDEPIKCLCYFANSDNHYYYPENDINKLAIQIYETIGPSGTNREYLYNACDAMRTLAKDNTEYLSYDSHLFQLENLVKKLDV